MSSRILSNLGTGGSGIGSTLGLTLPNPSVMPGTAVLLLGEKGFTVISGFEMPLEKEL
jgi:hypothetical protein